MDYENIAKFIYPEQKICNITHFPIDEDNFTECFVFENDKGEISSVSVAFILDKVCEHLTNNGGVK